MWKNSVYVELRDFGKNMQMLAIFMMVSLIPGVSPIAMILYLIFMLSALKNIKLINYSLDDKNLVKFRSKMVSSITRGFLAILSLIAGGIFLAVGFMLLQNNHITIIIAGLLLLLGFILMISSFATEKNAWNKLNQFFLENKENFPDLVSREAIEATENLQTSAVLYALFMFGVTMIIGFIFRIIGYFKLAKLNHVIIPVSESIVQVVQTPSKSSKIVQESSLINFCPICGAKLSKEGVYCAECGSKLK